MLELTVNIGEEGGFFIRFACPCGQLHCDDEPLELEDDTNKDELNRLMRERLATFTNQNPRGVECSSCGERSTLASPPLAHWIHPDAQAGAGMSGSSKRRARRVTSARDGRERAEHLLARASSLPSQHGSVMRAAAARRGASAVLSEVDDALDELRARGYRELPDGRWLNPQGEIVRGSARP